MNPALGLVLALVKPSALQGRSGKFAKHLALGMQAAQTFIPGRAAVGATWDSVCHMAGIEGLGSRV